MKNVCVIVVSHLFALRTFAARIVSGAVYALSHKREKLVHNVIVGGHDHIGMTKPGDQVAAYQRVCS